MNSDVRHQTPLEMQLIVHEHLYAPLRVLILSFLTPTLLHEKLVVDGCVGVHQISVAE
jgi:hypothetical protein